MLALADKVKSVYQTIEHMHRFLGQARLIEKMAVMAEALDAAPWTEMGDHTLFTTGQNLKAGIAELQALYETSYLDDGYGGRLMTSNGRLPVLMNDCADRLKTYAEDVIKMVGVQ